MSASIPIIDPRRDSELQAQNELVARMQSLMVQYIEVRGLTRLTVIGALECVKTSLVMQTIEVKGAKP